MKKFTIVFSSFVVIFLLLFFSFNSSIYAGTTGKVQGTIVDSESNEPLPGVNVMIEGTTLGAATDESGFFFIINIPPGTYALKASMIGYAVETKSDVRVYVDRTTTEDFELKTAAIAGEEVTVTASRAPVPLDVSQTESYVSGEDVVESPIGRFDQLIGMQAGVEYPETWGGSDAGRGFSVRGGEVAETDVQIDGISMMNKSAQQVQIPISRNLIQDVQILTGGFNAEYGNIRSGLINIITKDGSYNRYSGVLEGRYRPNTPKVFFPDEYDNVYSKKAEWYQNHMVGPEDVKEHPDWRETAFSGVSTDMTYHYRYRPEKEWNYYRKWMGFDTYAAGRDQSAQFFYELEQWFNRPIPYMESGDVMLDLSAGGPVPFLSNTKFFASGYWNRSEYPLITSRPHSHEYSASLKLTRRLASNMVLVFSNVERFVYAVNTGDRGYERHHGQYYATWGGAPATYVTGDDRVNFSVGDRDIYQACRNNPQYDKSHTFRLKLTHTYSPATYYEISVGTTIFECDVDHMRWTDPTLIKWIYDPDTNKEYGFDERPWGYNPRMATNADGWAYQRRSATGQEQRSYSKGTLDNLMNDFNIRMNIVSQVNKYNQIKAGIQLAYTHCNTKGSYTMTTAGEPITERPYNWSKWKADPVQLEWFVQDKLEWEGMILNVGLRGLTFLPRTNALDVGEHNFFKYDEDGNPYWVAGAQWGAVEGEGNWMWQEFQTREVKNKILLQPRVGISHPITESSKIFFNYGHFFTSPHWNQLFSIQSVPILGGLWGNTGLLPLPDLKWPKVVSYEIGIQPEYL